MIRQIKTSYLRKISLNILFLIVFLFFVRNSFFQFYILFEMSLVPTLFIIFHSGKQLERIKSGIFLFFYTLVSSFPIILILILLRLKNFMWNFNEENFEIKFNFFFSILLFLRFFIKLPIFFFHSWLLKAHVQAPVYGSIILARVILKLGGFGFFKFRFYYYNFWIQFILFFKIIILTGIIISRLICLYLTDLKIIIALSSVSHISFLVLRIVDLMYENFKGSLTIIISHGFRSALIFYFLNLFYKRIKTRRIFFSKSVFSFYTTFFLSIICIINFRIPPSLNFFREIILTINILSWIIWLLAIVLIYMFIGTLFSLLLLFYLKDKAIKKFFFCWEMQLKEIIILFFFIIIRFMFSFNFGKL